MNETTLYRTITDGATWYLDLMSDGRFAVCKDDRTNAVFTGFPAALAHFNECSNHAVVTAGSHVSEFSL